MIDDLPSIEELMISRQDVVSWVDRLARVREAGIEFNAEGNESMKTSYCMLDARRRSSEFFSGRYVYGPPILNVGFQEAWRNIRFNFSNFRMRKGEYDWEEHNQVGGFNIIQRAQFDCNTNPRLNILLSVAGNLNYRMVCFFI